MDEAVERGHSSSDPSSSLMKNLPCPNLRLTPDRLQYFRQQQIAAQQNDQSSNSYSLPITRSQITRSATNSLPTSSSSSSYCATDSYYQNVPHHDSADSSLHRQDGGVIVANNQNRISDQEIVEYPPYNPDEDDDDDDDDDDSSYSENSEDEYSSEEERNGKVQPNGIMNRTVDGAGAVRMQCNHVPLPSSATSSHLPSFPSFTHPNMNSSSLNSSNLNSSSLNSSNLNHPNMNHHHVALTGLHVHHQNQYLNLSQQSPVSPFLPQTSVHGSQVLLLPSHPSNNFLNNCSVSIHPTAGVTGNSFHQFYAHHPFTNTSSTGSSLPILTNTSSTGSSLPIFSNTSSTGSSLPIFSNHTVTSNVAQSPASNHQQPLVTQTGRRDTVLTASYHRSSNPNNQVCYSSIEEDHYYTDLSLSIPHHRHKNVNGVILSNSSTPHPNSGNSTTQFHQNLSISNDYQTCNQSLGLNCGEDEDLSTGSNCSYDTHNTESSCEPIEIESTSDQCLITPSSSSSEGDDNFGEIIKQTMQVDSISASV